MTTIETVARLLFRMRWPMLDPDAWYSRQGDALVLEDEPRLEGGAILRFATREGWQWFGGDAVEIIKAVRDSANEGAAIDAYWAAVLVSPAAAEADAVDARRRAALETMWKAREPRMKVQPIGRAP